MQSQNANKSGNYAGFRGKAIKALDMLLPPRCVVSGDPVERQGMISSSAWAGLDFIAAPYCSCCGAPFAFEAERQGDGFQTHDDSMLCGLCLQNPPPYKSARAALIYNDTSRKLILGFKHADKTYVVKAFNPWLMRAAADMISDADVLVPVPLHYHRLVARRYNQAALIADSFSQICHVPVLKTALKRVRATPSQGHLKATQRAKNVKRAFAVSKRDTDALIGKSLILIDDVYTTGSTVKECTKTLLGAGAKEVSILTLARVMQA